MAKWNQTNEKLGFATTRELLEEVWVRMTTTQDSPEGRKLASMCSEAMVNLDDDVLDLKFTPKETGN